MNWITTNIRFPEENYMILKLRAARERKSVAKFVREAVDKLLKVEDEEKKLEAKKILKELDRVAIIIGKRTGKKWNSVKALREVRYYDS